MVKREGQHLLRRVHDCMMCNSVDTAKQLVRKCSVRTQTEKKKLGKKKKGGD